MQLNFFVDKLLSEDIDIILKNKYLMMELLHIQPSELDNLSTYEYYSYIKIANKLNEERSQQNPLNRK